MHSLLDVPRPKLARLEHGLSSTVRQARWKKWRKEGYDGIEINTIGGAYGPTWPKGMHKLDILADFPGLQGLSVNVSALESLEPLSLVADSLESLAIGGGEESQKASCRPIALCQRLRWLSLARIPKDIKAIESLTQLEELRLLGFALKSLDIVRPLKKLERLWIGFGSLPEIESIGELPKLKALEMIKVRKLTDLTPLSRVKSLQYLALCEMKEVTQMPDCTALQALRRVYLDTMNGLTDLSGLTNAPKLEDLIVLTSKIEASVFDPIIAAARPGRVTVGLASRKAEAVVEVALGTRAVSLFGTQNEKIRLT